MSFHEVPPFDMLTGLSLPFDGFGNVLKSSQERIDKFCGLASQACHRIEDTFAVAFQADAAEVSRQLDAVIDSMWEEGWDPSTADVNLFATDFGLVLAAAMCTASPESLTFRSESDISHISLWYIDRGVEAFPFHKVVKRLLQRDGESIASFVDGVQRKTTA